MIDFILSRKNIMLALAVMFVIVSLSGTTYSLFFNAETTNTFTYSTGLLDLQISEDEQIVLANAFPTIDSEGMKSKPYKLTIKNIGTLPYVFDLRMLSTTEENTIDTKYIKVMVDDNLPTTLYATSGTIASNVIVYPEEERVFSIRMWLDFNTPNQELGKTFIAKIATTGESTYRTLDSSNANAPELLNNMISVRYNDQTASWETADENNMLEINQWYDYGKSLWANSIVLKDSPKQIYDLTGNHHIKLSQAKTNNGNIILGTDYLDLGVKYKYDVISTIFRLKFDNLKSNKIYLITNDRLTYYYDTIKNYFVLDLGTTTVTSKEVKIEQNEWYILGFTYDGTKVTFYLSGEKLSSTNVTAPIQTTSSFKVGTSSDLKTLSKITVGDIYIYNRVLTPQEIATNYKINISTIYDSLIAGYNEFYPMNLQEYYESAKLGKKINLSDVQAFYVWIPRFKYKTWNVTGETVTPLYQAKTSGIDITFEEDRNTSGTIYCQKGICYNDSLMITKVTKQDNGKYYTHPAFTKDNQELTGFWVSKYEISQNNDIESKPGNIAATNKSLINFYQDIINISKNNNYHMIKNTEWAAITYLSHSKYGLCDDNTCKEVLANQTYASGSNLLDTTTGNQTGVYDMAGSAAEFVMGNYANLEGQISLNNLEIPNINIEPFNYDLYYPNTFILGDATLEVTTDDISWSNGLANFVNETNNWFVRGGIANYETGSIFSYRSTINQTSEYITTRITIN